MQEIESKGQMWKLSLFLHTELEAELSATKHQYYQELERLLCMYDLILHSQIQAVSKTS